MPHEMIVLRLIHVLGGTFWVGSGIFTTLFLMPALSTAGPAAGPLMAGLQRRKLFLILPIVALLTIGSGLRLMWLTSGGFDARYFAAPSGVAFAMSGVAAMVAFVLSLAVARPAMLRAGAIAATMASLPDDTARAAAAARVARLQQANAIASRAAVALLVAGAMGMAVARYLG